MGLSHDSGQCVGEGEEGEGVCGNNESEGITAMTDIGDTLTRRGWRTFPNQFKPNAVSYYAPPSDRHGLPDCECNDKAPGIYVCGALIVYGWPRSNK